LGLLVLLEPGFLEVVVKFCVMSTLMVGERHEHLLAVLDFLAVVSPLGAEAGRRTPSGLTSTL